MRSLRRNFRLRNIPNPVFRKRPFRNLIVWCFSKSGPTHEVSVLSVPLCLAISGFWHSALDRVMAATDRDVLRPPPPPGGSRSALPVGSK